MLRNGWARVSRNGVPHRALLASTAGIIAAILLAIFAPKNAFLMLYGTAVAGMLFVWLVILNTHLRFRKAITRERLLSLPMRLRAHPLFTVVGILLLLAISVTTFFVDGLQWSVPAFSVFLGLISLLYLQSRRRETIFQNESISRFTRTSCKESTQWLKPAKRFTLRSTGDSKVICCVPSTAATKTRVLFGMEWWLAHQALSRAVQM